MSNIDTDKTKQKEITNAIAILNSSNNHKILKRVPEEIIEKKSSQKSFKAAFIDLETTGLDPKKNEIIEVGTLIASFTNEDGFININYSNNQLQEPKIPISEEITKITGITNEDVKGKKIDWNSLKKDLETVDLIICHNAYFDRNFMELQTPEFFQDLIKSKPFGCSANSINWRELGYESAKLEYLNLKMGFFYDGHRALIDCYATLNLFIQNHGAFEELKNNIRQKEILLCAKNASFNKKDILKERSYRWSSGDQGLPKSWWTIISQKDYDQEILFLKSEIFETSNINIPTKEITAKERYSLRAQTL